MPKQEVLDPQGKAICQSLHALGYAEVDDVRLGKYMELRLRGEDANQLRARVDDMCRRLLANGVIEEYHLEVERLPAATGAR
jgi:phosphoribosylformylglycinamidine synthase